MPLRFLMMFTNKKRFGGKYSFGNWFIFEINLIKKEIYQMVVYQSVLKEDIIIS